MLVLKIALRSLLRRRQRALTIGVLVCFGTLLLVLGQTFTRSAGIASRQSIIDNFTGDLILYSERSREKPSPFAFNSPLPLIAEVEAVRAWLERQPLVEAVVPFAQNYALIQATHDGQPVELPFIFYAIEPEGYRRIFRNVEMRAGSWFGLEGPAPRQGILISEHQNRQYRDNYGVSLAAGQPVTLLSLTAGGSVNAQRSELLGLFEPRYFKNVFNYINFMDLASYASLYNFTGVAAGSLPESLARGLEASVEDEAAIFALAQDEQLGNLDLSSLREEPLSGYTMIAVRLTDHAGVDRLIGQIEAAGLGVKAARWDEASGFFARVSSGLQAFIILATGLIFLVVALIFMNTLIISIVERTSEIGTMRALGGEKSFIRRLFLAETLLLNLPFSLGAMVLSLAAVLAVGSGGLPLPETVSQYLIGGGPLPLKLAAAPFLEALAVVLAVSIAATLYPIRVATRITPLAAMGERAA